MTKLYFYIKNDQKIGPLRMEQLMNKIDENTLIWFQGLDDWTKAYEIKEINDIFNSASPPFQPKEKKSLERYRLFKYIFVFILLVIIGSGISYFKTRQFKDDDFNELGKRIDDVFNGNDEICDYNESGVKGTLNKISEDPMANLMVNIKGVEDLEIYEYFGCSSGGWTVYSLKRLNNGYEYVESKSTDMGFKVPESTYHPGTDLGYGIKTSGYSIPTYRGSVQNAYNKAMEYLSIENKNKSYVAGAYGKIITFDELKGELHKIENIHPTNYSSASVNSKDWQSVGEAYVYNDNWIVWYKDKGKHYEIVLDKDLYYEKLIFNFGIAFGIAFLLTILWFLAQKLIL